ncbi:hypothetical protein BB039_09425 [Neisseria gonorrhoeae]|uniref:Uncharacterized protein n=3 Tax=Neisseria gonorrhoeae TaxID=485 RepID=Q5F5P3_NEIG1|nr:hypothetical protein NGO_1874 [Neisseria gonorrhoeae FA 1090]ACF30995.1 Conserved hypothetical protein [Neisseria gonorrhoeae NCCP11945]ANJ48715.1 hypothetical protein ASO12_10365 [Neisseria gonorrhoeae]EEH63140.1 predicted protein [Neisseria gonorrhoeae 1291]EEZ42547.1 conserved hypothetical protein [Neisseria gonorrhoeae 35/02]EFE05141.1 conserved hypothetical protein [Neisseria gonorrhoeae DGI2]EFF40571.1 hypothetical protein NGNG_01796 [Neisseria gonorrhoeae F62]KLS10958.1 hypothetica
MQNPDLVGQNAFYPMESVSARTEITAAVSLADRYSELTKTGTALPRPGSKGTIP